MRPLPLRQRPSVIIFDLDGTLIDSARDITEAANVALAAMDRPPLPQDVVSRYIGNGVPDLLTRCLGGPHPRLDDAVVRYREHYDAHALDHTRLYPGILDLLQRLTQSKLAVVSNKLESFCRSILRGLGVESFFHEIAGGDTFSERKPSPLPFLQVLERFGQPPAAAIVIGDGPQDLLAARAAGIPCCAVLWGFTPRERLEREQPMFLAETVAELAHLLQAIDDR